MIQKFQMFIYFTVLIQRAIMEINKNYASTFGTQFVTLFPWSNKVSNSTSLTFEIVNASENETATIVIEYDIGLGHFKSMAELSKDVIHVAPNSFLIHKFDPTTVMTRPLKDDRSSVISVGATRIFISSNLSISIIECIFITRRNGDCFTVLPITMAGNHYSFSIATFMGISTAYFIPTYTDSYINITTITRESFKRVNSTNRISRFDHGSMIYAYNNSINDSFTVHITSSSPIVILLAIRTQLTDISSESFACTMLMPLPDNVYSRIALRDDFDVHFTPLQSFENCQTHLFLSPPMQSCQTFTVATFRPNSTKLINVEPCNVFDNIVMQWNYHFKDAIIGYASNNTLFQLLRFEIYQNLYSFLDMIPAYSQYLTGRMCFPFKNESEQLFLYDISRQQDSIALDGKVVDAEYMQYFENSFRSITMRKINTTKLERGMHCLESNGRYLLFIFGGNRRNYGYAYAFNAYPTETLKWTMKNDANLYHQDIFGVSFITLFPWMTVENASGNFNIDLSLDILNPHPYMFARVRISYYNGSKGNLTEILYNIKPYTHHKLKMNKIMMTKLYNAYNVSIYKSYYDSRIKITSTIPISVTQSCFIGNRIGDSFTVLPLKMAGQNYSFSLPKSVANNSHSIVYLLPSYQTTKISFIAKVDGEEKLYNIKTKAAKNSSIFAYYGSGEEVSMNLWSDKSFQVIIALQRLLIIHNTEHRLDFACTMAVPMSSQSVCSTENDISLHDMHYMFIAQHYNYSGFFTMTPSDSKCSAYYVDFFPRKKSTVKEIKRLKFEPATMQHYFQLSGQIFSDFSTMYCRNDYIQVYSFGSSNMEGSYIDFIPSTQQYVTGRSHFVASHYQNWVLIFMDQNAINDIEMDGVFISNNYVYEMLSPNNSGYFALQTVHSTVRLHYVQSTGYYSVHILSDTSENGFYQYFVTLSSYRNIIKNREQKSYSNITTREVTTEKTLLKSSSKPFQKIVCDKELSLNCKSITNNKNESDTIMLDHRNIAKGIRARNMFASGNSIKLTTAALIIIIQLLLLLLIKIV